MSASIQVWSYHGNGSGTTTNVLGSTIRHKRADNDTADLNNELRIPASGEAFGWRKQLKMAIMTPPQQPVSNLRFFCDPDPTESWVGVSLYAGVTDTYKGPDHGTRSSPSPPGSIDEQAQLLGTVNADGYTASAPLVINAGAVAVSTDVTPTVGTQSFLVLQAGVAAGSTPGRITERLGRWRYNEM